MRKIVVSTFMSLDGVIENPRWTFPYWNDEIAKFQQDDLFAADALLLGRVTYQGFVSAWPGRAGTDDFADRMNALPKHVASRTLESAEWNASIIKGNVPEEIAKLKAQPGMNILKYGGGELLQTLIDHRLLDELHVLLYPVTVGKGVRLTPDGGESKLILASSQVFSSGVIGLIYTLAPAVEA